MNKLLLDTEKVLKALAVFGKTQAWLAEEIGESDQLVSYWLINESVYGAKKIAKALHLKTADLIK